MKLNLSLLRNLETKKLDSLILIICIGFTILQSYFFYGYPLGIGYPLFIGGLVGAIGVLSWNHKRTSLERKNSLFWGVSALFFAYLVAVRKEELLVFINSVISLYSVALLVSRGDFMSTPGYFPMLRTLALPWAFLYNTRKFLLSLQSQSPLGDKGKIISMIGISLPLILVYFILFSAGDLSFREAFGDIGDTLIKWATNIIPLDLFGRVLFAIAVLPLTVGLIHAAVYSMVFSYKRSESQVVPPQDGAEIFTPLYAACLAFLPFSFLQIQSALRGHENITNGLSYATYAKDGYFALLLAALLTLGIILFVGKRTYFLAAAHLRIK